ncbi:MAG TPA: hypothetical protein VHC43_17665 [Mycobacteriales bacterium]|nr:hypothetical protein [Mycobacteriales bacterium]
MNRVKAGFFSLTPTAPPDDDGRYLRWHLLDHMPEQYSIPGIVLGLRWIADGDYPNHRIVAEAELAEAELAEVGNAVLYLMSDPVQPTYDAFMDLGGRLRDAGRFPETRPSLQTRLLAIASCHAAPAAAVSAEVVPFRPHRGVVLIVEGPNDDATAWHDWLAMEHESALLEVPGVAGIWSFQSNETWKLRRHCEGPPQRNTVIFLEADPIATTEALAPMIERRWSSHAVRPMFAGPLRTMIDWEVWRQ